MSAITPKRTLASVLLEAILSRSSLGLPSVSSGGNSKETTAK